MSSKYAGYEYTLFDVSKQDKVLVVKFNNPKKKNCVNRIGYMELERVMCAAALDETITIVVLTGVGDFFTAGNDLSQSSDAMTDPERYTQESSRIFKAMVNAVIDCPKVLIAVVNGPSIGIGTTLCALCDVVWCSETAYFATPFTSLGIVPEAGSSLLLPFIVGRSKASEMLLLSQKLSAMEAYHYNFVSRVFKPTELDTVIWPLIREYSELPPGSLQASKKLLRMHEKEQLNVAINAECDALNKRFLTDEFFNAVMQFAMRKSKAKL